MNDKPNHLAQVAAKFNKQRFQDLHEELTFADYLEKVYQNPRLIRTSFQRIYDMIAAKGYTEIERHRKKLVHYHFFDDEEITIVGLEEPLAQLVGFIRGAAGYYGTERRILLMHGPVGSAKSTIARALKRGLEKYTSSDDGLLYTFKWVNLPTGQDGLFTHHTDEDQLRDDPLRLIPQEIRRKIVAELNQIFYEQTPEDERVSQYNLISEGELNPRSKKFMEELLVRYKGDWHKVVSEHIKVIRLVLSEAERKGIATFQPKDEKNQDATELTGDIDYSKLPHYGKDSDPRAFNFDGELCVAHRGMVEFIEMLKLAQEFLYDLLGASQEKQIKPKKFSQVSVDEFIMGHSNSHEYNKLLANEAMEALKDRASVIDFGYVLRWEEEIKVLELNYGKGKVRQHIAPHTLEIAALWAILTRLEDDKEGKLDLVKKAKLYNGQALPGYTEDMVKELQSKHTTEGFKGVSCRYLMDKISNCLANNHKYINPFLVLNEILTGLSHYSLIKSKDDLARYQLCGEMAIQELVAILKDEVRHALVADEKAIERLCANYIDNVMAYIRKSKITNKFTGKSEQPSERLMRAIEEKIDVPDVGADDFRRMIAAYIGEIAHEGKQFKWDSNAELKKALEAKLFEDVKDHIKLSALHTKEVATIDPHLQEKIDALKKRLIDSFGYNEASATDMLDYIGSIFAQNELADEDK